MNTVNRWIAVTNLENWQIINDKLIWGVSKGNRKMVERLKPKDLIAFYVKRKQIAGLLEVDGDFFQEDSELFPYQGVGGHEVFPYRVKLRRSFVSRKPLMIDEIINRLDFIRNKKNWQCYFRKTMFSISAADYKTISEELKKQT